MLFYQYNLFEEDSEEWEREPLSSYSLIDYICARAHARTHAHTHAHRGYYDSVLCVTDEVQSNNA
jgi:hypothetical protein